jgi:predicted acetyltransferase
MSSLPGGSAGSIKVIEKYGGRFTNTVVDEDGNLDNVYHIMTKE